MLHAKYFPFGAAFLEKKCLLSIYLYHSVKLSWGGLYVIPRTSY